MFEGVSVLCVRGCVCAVCLRVCLCCVFEGVSGVCLGIYLGHMPSISKRFSACQERLWMVTLWTE